MIFKKKLYLVALSLFYVTPVSAYEEGFQHATCEQVIEHILENLDQENRKLLLNVKKEDLNSRRYITGWGSGIRGYYGIGKGNFSLMYSCKAYGDIDEFHPVAVTGVIMESVWERVNSDGSLSN